MIKVYSIEYDYYCVEYGGVIRYYVQVTYYALCNFRLPHIRYLDVHIQWHSSYTRTFN